jgi:peroxiredoxin (alkyl hydroperoxide reductase subunit C)
MVFGGNMSQLRIGDHAPDFKVKGVLRGQVAEYSLSSYKGKWWILFFYPADFTFICPTELEEAAGSLRRKPSSPGLELVGKI